jgi:hypothetical protein
MKRNFLSKKNLGLDLDLDPDRATAWIRSRIQQNVRIRIE